MTSVSVTLTSTITSVPRVQKPRMSKSPLSSSLPCLDVGDEGSAFEAAAVRLLLINGSSRIAEFVNAWEHNAPNSSLISLWRRITRPPFLQDSPCATLNVASHPSHFFGRSGGVRAYRRNRASRNSCGERTVPFMIDGNIESQCPVSFPRRIARLVSGESLSIISSNVASRRVDWRVLSSVLASRIVER